MSICIHFETFKGGTNTIHAHIHFGKSGKEMSVKRHCPDQKWSKIMAIVSILARIYQFFQFHKINESKTNLSVITISTYKNCHLKR